MAKIVLEGMEFRAYIGVYAMEQKFGNRIVATVELESIQINGATDNLEETIDYSKVYDIVKTTITIPAKLLEHAAHNILEQLKENFEHRAEKISITLKKMHPLVDGIVNYSAVTLYWELGMP